MLLTEFAEGGSLTSSMGASNRGYGPSSIFPIFTTSKKLYLKVQKTHGFKNIIQKSKGIWVSKSYSSLVFFCQF